MNIVKGLLILAGIVFVLAIISIGLIMVTHYNAGGNNEGNAVGALACLFLALSPFVICGLLTWIIRLVGWKLIIQYIFGIKQDPRT